MKAKVATAAPAATSKTQEKKDVFGHVPHFILMNRVAMSRPTISG
jgi:hypothetical protein